MIKMRAVPDDFDNVQALHSQYGAVPRVRANMAPLGEGTEGVAYGVPPGNYAPRPLMVDHRRQGAEGFMPPPNLALGGRSLSSGLGHQEEMEGVAPASRLGLGQDQATTQLRELAPRYSSDALQPSGLRTGLLAWKSESFDYPVFQGTQPGQFSATERHPSSYSGGRLDLRAVNTMGGYDEGRQARGKNFGIVPCPNGLLLSWNELLRKDSREQGRVGSHERHISGSAASKRIARGA